MIDRIYKYVFISLSLSISHTVLWPGKKVFMLTNSPYKYTDVVMQYVINDLTGKKWQDYFDYIVTRASKPAFFQQGTPFR